jgi:serine/threonine protein kinase
MSPASPPSGTFDPRVYERLTALFDELVEVDPATRRARLKALAESEADLARELEALLLADARAEGILERSPTTMAREVATGYESGEYETPVVALPKTEAGMRLGPWRLLEPIGEGGMGEVWKAERADDSFDQFVAVKILRQGVVSAGMHRRFLVERQILARLHHPAIARLLDGGVAPDGRPYFVMELVQGLPLHEHARSKKLGIDDRLRLFTTGCEAVEAAHRQLVVHRDLKPSNILVSEAGEVKLLDFGIAKVLEPDLFTEAEGATRLDGRALTPEYAAPEQILGEPVTTATDVYGLGLVLYELLVGKRPFRRDGSLGEMVEALDSEEPDRPSTVVVHGESSEVVAPTERKRWARRLRGDLDTIVLRALAREPERRYPSVAALRDDVRRFLAGRPIRARIDGMLYRSFKFVARHRWAALASGGATVVLVSSVFVALRQGAENRAKIAQAEAALSEVCAALRLAPVAAGGEEARVAGLARCPAPASDTPGVGKVGGETIGNIPDRPAQ